MRRCVKCGRKGPRGFVALNANEDTYAPGRDEWICASRSACQRRQKAEEGRDPSWEERERD